MSLTDSLNYKPKAGAVQSRSYRNNVKSNSSSYTQQQTILIDIPCGRPNTFLDQSQSYLKMKVAIATQNAIFDGTASSIISRLDIYHASNLIESITDYNVLASLLFDFSCGSDTWFSTCNVMMGSSSATNRQGLAVAAAASATVCLPLISGVVGTLADKYLPLGEMSGGDLRLEITLASDDVGLVNAVDGTVMTVSEVEFVCQIVELSDDAGRQIRQMNGGNYQIHGTSFRGYTNSMSAVAGTQSLLVPARFTSLKSLLVATRNSASAVAALAHSVSGRSRDNISSAQLRVGSLSVPQKAIDCTTVSEPFAELLKAFHAISISDYSTLVNRTTYDSANSAAADHTYAWAIGFELESFSLKNDVLQSGINSISQNIFLDLTCSTALTAAYTINTFACIDHMLTVQNGIMVCSF